MLAPEILMNAFSKAIDNDGNIILDAILENGLTANEMMIALTAVAFICSGIACIILGYITNLPFIQGPSIFISTFITYTVCVGFGYTYSQALAIVFLSGLFFFILAAFRIEKKIYKAIPINIKYAVICGIGLFIAYQGLLKGHIIEGFAFKTNFFNILDISSINTKTALLSLAGVILICILHKKHIHGSIFIGKIACIILAIPLGLSTFNIDNLTTSIRIDKVMFNMDFSGLIDVSNYDAFFKSILAITIVLFSICIMDIFETMAMLIVADNFVSESKEGFANKNIPKILEIDAITTSLGSTIGCVTVSTYIESTTGIVEGGRTGLTSIITGILFLATTFLSPLASLVPSAATATTLIMAGVMMMSMMKFIDFENIDEALPAFLTMFLMPITSSILIGIASGVISYVIIHIFLGKAKSINKMLYILSGILILCLIYLPR